MVTSKHPAEREYASRGIVVGWMAKKNWSESIANKSNF
jgi:hypothetical protein